MVYFCEAKMEIMIVIHLTGDHCKSLKKSCQSNFKRKYWERTLMIGIKIFI
jgi:hypothetical protein